MNPLAWDTETAKFRPGKKAPELVCVSFQRPGSSPRLEHHSQVRPLLEKWLSSDTLFIGHHVAYDFAVVCARFPDLTPAVFKAYEENRVTDTKIRQQLLDIAAGVYRGRFGEGGKWIKHGYTLDELSYRHRGFRLKKDTWRMAYGAFLNVSLDGWVEHAARLKQEAQELLAQGRIRDEDKKETEAVAGANPEEILLYPLEDATATLEVWQKQEVHAAYLEDQYRQARAAWWLHLTSTWGLRTRMAGVEAFRQEQERALKDLQDRLMEEGLVRADGSRDTKKASARMLEVCGWKESEDGSIYEPVRDDRKILRVTPAGGVCLDADACKNSEDEILKAYGDFGSTRAVLAKDIPMLAAGTLLPVHTSFDMAETGRTTSSGPNIQNLRRLEGIRECFTPRPGKVFIDADYPQLELRTLAQVCVSLFGASELANALNAGIDPHTALAADILGISYEEATKFKKREDVSNARQTAKVANFGFPGGLGIEKLCLFARKTYKVVLSEERAKELKTQWLNRWPEMRAYFAMVNKLCNNPANLATFSHLFSGRLRGAATYTAACNSFFQGLGSDATKHAGWLISKACYTDLHSPLFNSRIVNYIHDEYILETEDSPRAHDAAMELRKLMAVGANEFLPNVPFKDEDIEVLLMRYWSKEAISVHNTEGRLMPWEAR